MAATDDYNTGAPWYKYLFDAQARSGEIANVSSSEQFDRDNLLHFIEDNFKSNVKGGVTLENLRAFLHVLVKSTRNQSDDDSKIVLATRLGRCYTQATNRYYYGDNTYAGSSWAGYVTDIAAIPAERAYNGIVAPFDLHNAGMTGVISNRYGAGDVDVALYYTDEDTGATSLANATLVGTTTITAVLDTCHNFEITSSVKIPKGKIVWALLRNHGWVGSTDYVYFQHTIFGSTHSSNWSSS